MRKLVRKSVLVSLVLVAIAIVSSTASGGQLRYKLDLVGSNGLFIGSQTSDLDVDPARNVAYVGSYIDHGVAVVDISDRSAPVVVDVLSTKYRGEFPYSSDSADVDLSPDGTLLAVASQPADFDSSHGFGGVTLYDTTDPYHPVQLGQVATGGVHDVQIDPGYPRRPYIYAANFESDDPVHAHHVSIIDASDPRSPTILSDYVSPEPQGCVVVGTHTCDQWFAVFNSAHDLTLLIHPRTGRVLLYVAYWDSGLRIVDVTSPASPVEVGSLDYTPAFTDKGLEVDCCAHYAQPTPSGDWVLLEDEVGIGEAGGVHVLDAHACDGTVYCTPKEVSFWSPPGAGTQASAIHATVNTDGKVEPGGIFQRYFSRDVHNLDVQEDRFLAPSYSSGVFLVDMKDKTNPTAIAFWSGAAGVKTACHGKNTLNAWGYQGNCYFQGREVWGAKFGDAVPGNPLDYYIYASDFWLGFLTFRTVTL